MATEEIISNGKVIQYRGFTAQDGTPAAIAGRVIDIPTGHAELLKEHDDWLRYQVVNEIVQRPNAWIDIYGYASKKGAVNTNLRLSEARTLAVKAVLESELRKLGRSLEGMVKIDHGFGENAPGYNAAESDNDARWRAVDVMVYGSRPADIKPPPLPQPPPAAIPATGWTVASENSVAGGVSVISGTLGTLIFTNLATKEKWRAHYAGAGLGKGLAPGSGTVSTSDMPSVDGRIYSFQTIHTVDQLLGALSIMVGISGTGADGAGGSATAILFGVTLAPVPFLWNLYTFLFRKQVLAVAGIAGTQLGTPDAGVSAVQIKFIQWDKM